MKYEVAMLLTENGYVRHPVYGFYSIPKKNLGYYFYLEGLNVTVGKIKWGTINIKEIKTMSQKVFEPHNYGLVTSLDRQQIELTKQRMLKNRNKQKNLINKGYKELPNVEEPPLSEE